MDKEEDNLDSDIPIISFIRIGQSLSPNGEINEEINGEEFNIKKEKKEKKKEKRKKCKMN
jgi:hypothetical protein